MNKEQTAVSELRCEYMENPLGIDAQNPRLSWKLKSDERDLAQTFYQIVVRGEQMSWDSGKTERGVLPAVQYDGPALEPRSRYFWKVRIWDNRDRDLGWSDEAWWETGLLSPWEWKGAWIKPERSAESAAVKAPPLFRRHFTLEDKKISAARLYITCHGIYSALVNGITLHPAEPFPPGFTSYHDRLLYRTYDVTSLLEKGDNTLGVIVGDGWWRGKITPMALQNVYGSEPALLCQLHVELEDGTQRIVVSDKEWKYAYGSILRSDMMDGEVRDARRDPEGWNTPFFDDGNWDGVETEDYGYNNLRAAMSEPPRFRECFGPTIIMTPKGETVLDFGQNIAGVVTMKVSGPEGTEVTLTHGETLDEKGNFTMRNLNPGKFVSTIFNTQELGQKDTFILSGKGTETFTPLFCFHGFRYVKVKGYPGEVLGKNFTASAIYSDMKRTGFFSCSNELVNRLQKNIEWSLKGNFLDIPTDCPQRERAGYTGDAQVFTETGSFIMETAGFFHKWLLDVAADQREDGKVPVICPDPSRYRKVSMLELVNGSAGWGDAIVIIPWTLYSVFGDTALLRDLYPAMKKWVDYIASRADKVKGVKRLFSSRERRERLRYIWDRDFHFGEWAEPRSNYVVEIFSSMLFSRPSVATAFFAYSAGLLSQAAGVLGDSADCKEYDEMAAAVKDAWTAEFLGKGGKLRPDTQASYVRAIAFDLLPEEVKPLAAARLAEKVRKNGYRIDTGFLSTPFICHVLSDYGFIDEAWSLLLQKKCPSWLYPVTKGATTIWEFWNAVDEKGKLIMSSHNHYSPGSVGSWLYQKVAGIRRESPGYKTFRLEPLPGGGVTHAEAVFESPWGEIRSSWRIEEDVFYYDVRVPPDTQADVYFPVPAETAVFEGSAEIETGIRNGKPAVSVGSGDYSFSCNTGNGG